MLYRQDAERRRLALELHDGAGQILVGALLQLDLAIRGDASPRLASARSLVAQALSDLRAVSRGLCPPALQQHGLAAALRQLAEGLGAGPTQIEVALEELPALSPAVALGLYRIAWSALTNTVRHARAGHAVVRLRCEGRRAVLEVEDDGRGYEAGAVEQGLGVTGMRERAAGLGGVIEVETGVGRGTCVRAVVPV